MQFGRKFFKTLEALVFKPGFLSSEYKKGNRSSYLDPLTMYLFIAAIFFLVFYTGFRNQKIYFGTIKGKDIVRNGKLAVLKRAYTSAKTKEDSVKIEQTIKSLEDNSEVDRDDNDREGIGSGISGLFDTTYKTIVAYDSAQRLLPADKRDGWFEKTWKRRDIVLSEHYREKGEYIWIEIVNKFIQYFPYIIFVLLPLFAVFFKLLYIRRRQFFFKDHSVFLVHIYTFQFIFMLLYLGILSLREYTDKNRLVLTASVILTFGCIYTLRAMKRFYEQGWAKTTVKFILFNLLCAITLSVVFVLIYSISTAWY